MSHPLGFEPGTQWSYSNTNYIVAGLVIEKITGTPAGRRVELSVTEAANGGHPDGGYVQLLETVFC